MPLRPEVRRFYGNFWKRVIRPRMLARAKNRCEFCGLENGVAREGRRGTYRVALAVAHRNHTPGDDRDSNLMVACQSCHLRYDWARHRDTRATRRDSQRPLLGPHTLQIL